VLACLLFLRAEMLCGPAPFIFYYSISPHLFFSLMVYYITQSKNKHTRRRRRSQRVEKHVFVFLSPFDYFIDFFFLFTPTTTSVINQRRCSLLLPWPTLPVGTRKTKQPK
jgi:hypothetical protein